MCAGQWKDPRKCLGTAVTAEAVTMVVLRRQRSHSPGYALTAATVIQSNYGSQSDLTADIQYSFALHEGVLFRRDPITPYECRTQSCHILEYPVHVGSAPCIGCDAHGMNRHA